MAFADGLTQILNGGAPEPPKPQVETAMEGTILHVFSTTATFVIEDFHPGQNFSPARFTRSSTPPVAGDKCLVTFVGKGIDKPWIISWQSA